MPNHIGTEYSAECRIVSRFPFDVKFAVRALDLQTIPRHRQQLHIRSNIAQYMVKHTVICLFGKLLYRLFVCLLLGWRNRNFFIIFIIHATQKKNRTAKENPVIAHSQLISMRIDRQVCRPCPINGSSNRPTVHSVP